MGNDAEPKDKSFSKPTGPWFAIAMASAVTVAVTGVGLWRLSLIAKPQNTQPAVTVSPNLPKTVTALGRLTPKGEVIQVSAPSLAEGARVEELKVEEGDRVRAGQVIAILDSHDRLQAALVQAAKEVKLQQAELAKVKAGAKAGEIAAQEAEIARWEAQLQRETEAQRAKIAKLEAQRRRDTQAKAANVARLNAQLRRVREAQTANVAKLEAQLKGERMTQKATVDRLRAELINATAEYNRHRELYLSGAISASLYDSKRLATDTTRERVKEAIANLQKTVQTLQEQINEAKANLQQAQETVTEEINQAEAVLKQARETGQEEINEAEATLNQQLETGREQINQAKATLRKIAQVRPEDIQAATASVEKAIAAQEKAQAELELSFVKAPFAGQILKIQTRQGERINNEEGIVELGRTDQMYVTAEVYETDITRVRPGQRTEITASAFTGILEGTVDQIGKKIGKKDVLNTDPAADADARVIEVKIRLDPESSRKVADLTNLQVEVKIAI